MTRGEKFLREIDAADAQAANPDNDSVLRALYRVEANTLRLLMATYTLTELLEEEAEPFKEISFIIVDDKEAR